MKPASTTRLLQVDLLKAVAILGVIVNHWMEPAQRAATFASAHVMQAVPVFLLLMGYNAKKSFDRRAYSSLAAVYRSSYLSSRLSRMLLPVAVVVPASVALALWRHIPLYLGPQTLLLWLPVPLRGQYFITVGVLFALVAPLLYSAYRRAPAATVVLCLALSLGYELLTPFKFFQPAYFLYQVNPLRFAGLFALGFWLADDARPVSRRNWFVLPAALASLGFLAAFTLGFRPSFVGPEYMYNVLSFGWPLLLTAAGLTWLPASPFVRLLSAPAVLGRASYHAFLLQALWFSPAMDWVRPEQPLLSLAAALGFSCLLGVLWHALTARRRAEVVPIQQAPEQQEDAAAG